MAYKVDFLDNETYGCSDLNRIRHMIATKGVMNESESSCKVVSGGTTGTVKIMPGIACFESGASIEVDSEGVTLNVIGSSTNYVYFEHDEVANTIAPRISTTAPTEDSDTVMLANVAGTAITDAREYSAFRMARGLP